MMTCLFDNKVLFLQNSQQSVKPSSPAMFMAAHFLEKVFRLPSGILQHDSILVYTVHSSMTILCRNTHLTRRAGYFCVLRLSL